MAAIAPATIYFARGWPEDFSFRSRSRYALPVHMPQVMCAFGGEDFYQQFATGR